MGIKPDYLTEDTISANQAYFLFSYFLTQDPEMPVMFKVRGFHRNMDEADAHAKRLTEKDPYHHVYVCDTGRWGGLYTEDRRKELLKEHPEIQEKYTEEKLQSIMKSHQEKTDESREHEEKRRKLLSQSSDARKKEISDLKMVNNGLTKDNQDIIQKLKELKEEQDDELKKVVEAQLKEKMSNNLFHIQNNNSKIEEFQNQLKYQKYAE